MKTILVLTDLSENAENAARQATVFAAKLHTNILLFNAYLTVPIIPQYSGGPWVIDEIKEREDMCVEKLKRKRTALEAFVHKTGTEPGQPVIHIQGGEGNLTANVSEILNQNKVEMVVMGARSGSTLDHIVSGSDTYAVIDKSTRPVLVVPQGTSLEKVKKIVFATDFEEPDITALRYLVKLGEMLHYEIEIVHINLFGETDNTETRQAKYFLRETERLKYPGVTYSEIRGKNVVNRLNDFCDETKADLLALTHNQDSFLMRLLRNSTTKKVLANQKIPLLVIPSNIIDE
jgi:nucleotide-binding universal stress UspA family protein